MNDSEGRRQDERHSEDADRLTVADVIEELKKLPQDLPLYFDEPETDESTGEWHFYYIHD
jgi:hypothetical protein